MPYRVAVDPHSGPQILQVISRICNSDPQPKRDTPYDAQRLQVIRAEEMANPTGFSVPSSEVVSISDTSAINHSSSSDQSTLLSMEQKKLKSLSGHAIAVTTEKSGSSNVHKAAQSSTTSTFQARDRTECPASRCPTQGSQPHHQSSGVGRIVRREGPTVRIG